MLLSVKILNRVILDRLRTVVEVKLRGDHQAGLRKDRSYQLVALRITAEQFVEWDVSLCKLSGHILWPRPGDAVEISILCLR